ncbi:MAG: Protein-export membrane protein SecF [Oscillospiraceae bacterium]|jgi:preprotein translocase subunit SecF
MRQFHIDFYGHRKIFFGISLTIFIIGLICNIVFGVKLDIRFTGGAMIRYSYSGELAASEIESAVQQVTDRHVSVSISQNVKSADSEEAVNNATISFAGTDSITNDSQKQVLEALNNAFPDANFEQLESNSVNASMGQSFFAKCLVAVLLAFLLLIIYIGVRFKNIGGLPAAAMGIVALLHDVLMVYFTFVVLRLAIDVNFMAVVLTILGYSLNDTIVIYDRIRENRRLMGVKTGYPVLVNTSINQNFSRTLYTSITTFVAIAVVLAMGIVYNLNSIITFALPMMVGVVSGCYSSDCIAGPLYVMWEQHKVKTKAAALAGNTSAAQIPASSAESEVKTAEQAGKQIGSAQSQNTRTSSKSSQKSKGKKKNGK